MKNIDHLGEENYAKVTLKCICRNGAYRIGHGGRRRPGAGADDQGLSHWMQTIETNLANLTEKKLTGKPVGNPKEQLECQAI